LFTNRDIADYYNQTQEHYQQWWKLKKAMAVHYGLWDKNTKTFVEALQNTNRALYEFSGIGTNCRVLDAGCGVGGSSVFLANVCNARATGITLSERQLAYANKRIVELGLENRVDFKLEDYTQTSFPDETFHMIWAIESLTSAPDKQKFAREAYRVLKPGGILVVADYFKVEDSHSRDPNQYLEKWRRTWSLAPILTQQDFVVAIESGGFALEGMEDITRGVFPTSKRMYYAALGGALPTMIYNSFHNTSRFAKIHYKSGIYQYKALKRGLWQYRFLRFRK